MATGYGITCSSSESLPSEPVHVANAERGSSMEFQKLMSVREVAAASPVFSEASLRWLIFNRDKNGFDEVVVKVGSRVLIDTDRFNAWLDSNRVAGSDRGMPRRAAHAAPDKGGRTG